MCDPVGVALWIVPRCWFLSALSFLRYRNAEADQDSQENDRPPADTSQAGRDSATDENKSSFLAETLANYSKRPSPPHFSFGWILLVYYRIYAEDGAIRSKTPAAPGDPFIGRIKARSVPPPHTAKTVKRCIAKMENIKDRTSTSLFISPYSQSPMADADKVTGILNRTGPGSTPQDPLALVAKISDSERSALESGRRGGLESVAESDTTLRPPEIQYRTSILKLSYFSSRNISTIGRSVLYALRRRLWYAIESSLWSRWALPWSYPGWFYCTAT